MKNTFVRLSTVLVIVLLCALPASLGCGGACGGAACPVGTGTGSLSITITGLIFPPDVTVGTQSVPSGTYLDLPAGSHEIITTSPVARAVSTLQTVREAYGARTPVQTACVRAGKTTEVTIDYLPIPTSKKASGTVTPDVVLTSADLGAVGWPGIYPAPSGLPLYHRLP